jgi:CHRD domain
MRTKLLALGLAGTSLAITACGSSSPGAHGAAAAGPVTIYRVAMSGSAEVKRGAAGGSGFAVIAFHGSKALCWRFAHLHGFTGATSARIYAGSSGKGGKVIVSLSPGPLLHHQGCRSVGATVVNAIEGKPSAYYVNVHSVKYPAGAVRGQI